MYPSPSAGQASSQVPTQRPGALAPPVRRQLEVPAEVPRPRAAARGRHRAKGDRLPRLFARRRSLPDESGDALARSGQAQARWMR